MKLHRDENWVMENMSTVVTLLLLVLFLKGIDGIRFVIDREECLSHNVHLEGDTIHVSFVVIQTDTPWHSANEGSVDLMIKGPSGEQIHGFKDKTSEKYEFVAYKKGIYQFCFTNKSPYPETLDFDVQVVHYTYHDQHVKNEHFDPLLDHISKLEAALYNIQFEQHWLEAQTDRQASLNEGMSQRAITKALLESLTLVGVSFLQVFLLQRLFEKKLKTVRV